MLAQQAGPVEAWERSMQTRRQDGPGPKSMAKEDGASTPPDLHSQNEHPQGMGRWRRCHGRGSGQLLSLCQSVPTRPQALGHQAENALRCVLSVPSLPHPLLPTPTQDPTGRREGRVGRKCWTLDPDKGQGWAEQVCFSGPTENGFTSCPAGRRLKLTLGVVVGLTEMNQILMRLSV